MLSQFYEMRQRSVVGISILQIFVEICLYTDQTRLKKIQLHDIKGGSLILGTLGLEAPNLVKLYNNIGHFK
jgi:hypothetical protein